MYVGGVVSDEEGGGARPQVEPGSVMQEYSLVSKKAGKDSELFCDFWCNGV